MTYAQELRFRQHRFTRHLYYLIAYIHNETDLTISLGDAYRSAEQQELNVKKGVSQTLDSMHLKRLAIDINFFEGDYYLFSDKSRMDKDTELIKPIGEYWELLDRDNKWGGFWKGFPDPMHFENTFK